MVHFPGPSFWGAIHTEPMTGCLGNGIMKFPKFSRLKKHKKKNDKVGPDPSFDGVMGYF